MAFFILKRQEFIPVSAKIKNARAIATAYWLKPPPFGISAANP
jgi:hypothetical protein